MALFLGVIALIPPSSSRPVIPSILCHPVHLIQIVVTTSTPKWLDLGWPTSLSSPPFCMKPTKSLGIGRERGQLPAVTSGLGVHFTTPTKGRRAPSRKTKKLASSALDFNARKQNLDAQLAAVVASAVQFKDLLDLQPSDPVAGVLK